MICQETKFFRRPFGIPVLMISMYSARRKVESGGAGPCCVTGAVPMELFIGITLWEKTN